MENDKEIIVAFIGLGMATMKTIDYLVKGGKKDDRYLSESEYHLLKTIHDIVNAKDADGIPMMYVPRMWIKTQAETMEAIKELTKQEERNAIALEHLIKLLERKL